MIRREQGFTLIELITVIVIVGILASMTSDLITLPVKSYFDQQRRTALVDSAESTLRLMQRDIRRALPNSIRITGSGTVLELLHTSDGGRYRAKVTSTGSGNILDFTSTDSSFDVIGTLLSAPRGELVIYNLGQVSADAYAGNNRATLSNTSTTTSISLASAKKFPLQSPQQRFFYCRYTYYLPLRHCRPYIAALFRLQHYRYASQSAYWRDRATASQYYQ